MVLNMRSWSVTVPETKISVLLSVVLTLASVVICHGIPHQTVVFDTNAPDAETQGVTVNAWWAKFSNVGDKHSCPTEPLSNAQDAARVRRVPMIFERPLKSIPMVLVSVTELSIPSATRLKYHAKAINITKEGFTLEFKVSCDTFVEEAELNWMALG